MVEPCDMCAHQLAELLARGELSARELGEAVLGRIEQVEGAVRSYITLTADLMMQQAAEADEARARGGPLGPLAGIPLALKDNLCTRGVRTTCASRILEPFVPPFDATVVDRSRQAGLVFVGKTNLDEFAMGSSTENSAFFPTHNPWDLDRVPGGSSGGSAAAVAAGEAVVALGSDTGGSIRQPASFCGVSGFKPTYGRVSRYGLVAFASSLDQIGPLAHDIHDVALLMNVIAGKDPRDSTSADLPAEDFVAGLEGGVSQMRVGLSRELLAEGVDPEVRDAVLTAARLFEELGAHVEETSLPSLGYALATYYLIAPAEASSNLARFDGVRYGYRTTQRVEDPLEMYYKTRQEGFGPEVKRRIMIGTYALSAGYYDAYYLKAQKVRTLIRRDFEKAFSQFQVLLSPVSPTVAFHLGEKTQDPLSMYLSDICTIPINLAGIPALSIPCGFTPSNGEGSDQPGLPIGLQIMGPLFADATVLRVGYAFQQATEYHRRRPRRSRDKSPQ